MNKKLRLLAAVGWRPGLGVGILALLVLAILFLLLDVNEIRESDEDGRYSYSTVLQSFVYVLAILVAGVLAVYKLRVFRDFEPHLTVSQTVSHRRIGDNYWHIAVTATLNNTSKVEVEILERFVRLQRVSPVSDAEVEERYSEVSQGVFKEFQWLTLKQDRRVWTEHEVIVEPGESSQETVEFIVEGDVRSILVHTYFYNPAFRAGVRTVEGWGATTVYDMMEGEG